VFAVSGLNLQRKDEHSGDGLRAGRRLHDRHIHVFQLKDGIAITDGGVLYGEHDHGARAGRIGR
jgi:hypothetical protein